MDTRHKILTPAHAIDVAADLRQRNIPYRVVTGYFDVLQPSLIEDLENLANEENGNHALFAVVLDPPQSLLTAQARTELAAALRVIDYVVHSDTGPAELIERLDPNEWVREEDEHLASTEFLIQHVIDRHGREDAPGSRERRQSH